MRIRTSLAGFPASRLRCILADLPRPAGYRLEVKPLAYRTEPHLQGLCSYDTKTITVQVPEPFRPFRERIPYKARRIGRQTRGKDAFRFRWFFRTVHFRTKTDVIRFLYCHEYYHTYLHDVLGRKGAAETACDRFALARFRRRPGARTPRPASGGRGTPPW